MQRNARYHWLGDRPHWQTMQLLARSRLLVLSSKMEGGANAVSEAITASVPLLCSRISGSIGLLGANYPGYFEVEDTQGLARLLRRAETDRAFYRRLHAWCRRLRPLFAPHRERAALGRLVGELAPGTERRERT
jgi:glycosyltransferase involved in cell wall biosynthesis